MTTNILALMDALGNLARFRSMPGQRYDSVEIPPPIDGIAFDGLIADKAFDANALVAELNERGAMRACKTDRSLEAMIHIVAAVINSR